MSMVWGGSKVVVAEDMSASHAIGDEDAEQGTGHGDGEGVAKEVDEVVGHLRTPCQCRRRCYPIPQG